MREILFRGKPLGKIDKDFVFGSLGVIDTDLVAIYQCKEFTEDIKTLVDLGTVGQYTGLTDKNGIKIFEGDIIQTKKTGLKGEKNYRFVIKYGKYTPLEYCREIYSQWQTIGFYALDGKREYQLSCCGDMLEVIGNIHDNPELLKSEVQGE